ncbi:hypothetical protein [Gulosibacter molinativorax]|uniref:hypothetical protein n=1 Tax=Gulosibacter molinativorax TaxID=256821 RepID=UPI0011B214B9|nr:hypothetical protein [Gulosibacter molinativorax]
MTTHDRTRVARAIAAFCAVLSLVGVLWTAERANALLADVAETGEAGLLTLRADPHPFHWQDAGPGETHDWLIEASLADATAGTLSLEMRADGALVTEAGMTVSVDSCPVAFSRAAEDAPPQCAGTATPVLPVTPIREIALPESGDVFPLADLRADEPRHLLVTLGIPADASPAELSGASATLSVGLHARGDSVPGNDDTGSHAGLAATGANVLALILLAVGLIGYGLSVRWLRVLRRREGHA